jgi:hypothetical protein
LKNEISGIVWGAAEAQGQFMIELEVADELERQAHCMEALLFDPVRIGDGWANAGCPAFDADSALDGRGRDGGIDREAFRKGTLGTGVLGPKKRSKE